MWNDFYLTDSAVSWATRETLLVVILGTLGLMILFGVVWRARRSVKDDDRDERDKMP